MFMNFTQLNYEAQKEVFKWCEENGKLEEILKADGKLKSTSIIDKICPKEMWDDFYARNLVWKKGTRKSFKWCCDQFGFRNNHISVLRKTHPKYWKGYMTRTGLGDEIMKLHRFKPSKISKIDFFDNAENLSKISPCAFDDVQITIDGGEYDSEI